MTSTIQNASSVNVMFCTLNLKNINVCTLNFRRKLSLNNHSQLFPVFQLILGFLSVDFVSIRQESCQSVDCQQHLCRVQRNRYEIVAYRRCRYVNGKVTYHLMLTLSVYKCHILRVKIGSRKVQNMSMMGISKRNCGLMFFKKKNHWYPSSGGMNTYVFNLITIFNQHTKFPLKVAKLT